MGCVKVTHLILILPSILLFLDRAFWLKLRVYKLETTYDKVTISSWNVYYILIFTYSDSKFVVICKNVDFECRYIIYQRETD